MFFPLCLIEQLWRILRSYEIRSTFYTEKTLRKFLCNPKGRVATEGKNNIVYEIVVTEMQSAPVNLNAL